ncbi:S1 family peptidase [Haloferula rosea]|uniref:Trypsin-like peptidase domain-containing protein n=1 Tax=Haloferula rosea TaxID=490093 RepID=A0A934VEY2_9BACT|nr:serine protease [Haloferula rosea]MBK1826501.1 trypsin-like peptidase domain-containing protein [Haloferula rosea]
MNIHSTMLRFLAPALIACAPAQAATGELHATATQLHETHADSVVWLNVIAKTSMSVDGDAPAQLKAQLSAQDRETTTETTGTFISKDGLIVTALAQLDQSSLVDGQTVNSPMGPIKLKAKSEVKEIKVIMPDGTEIPADLVLKDTDLGLGFVKLRMDSDEADGVEIKAIDLANSAKGSLLDDCIGLGRLDDSMNREPSVITSEISGITTKPRTFYRVNADAIGSPIFLSNGKLLGITVVRKPAGNLSGSNTKLTPVVLPAADVAKIAEQAKDAEPEIPSEAEEPEEEAAAEE